MRGLSAQALIPKSPRLSAHSSAHSKVASTSSSNSSSSSPSPALRRLQHLERQFSTSSAAMASTSGAASSSQEEDQLVLPHSKLGLRTLTMNREKKLNSLNLPMMKQIRFHIDQWENSDAAKLVLLKSRGRAFCAGGDVAAASVASKEDATRDEARSFFKTEYETNNLLAKLKTPALAFMDGITMGGGVGLAGHLPLRVATERTMFAMPETSIGLFPDVGATKRLATLPGAVGAYLALTSARLSGVDCYVLGLATHLIPSDQLQSLEDRLAELELNDLPKAQTLDLVNQVLDEYAADASTMGQASIVGERRQAIDYAFGQDTVEGIVQALEKMASGQELASQKDWAQSTLNDLNMRSPTSCKVALVALRNAAQMNIDQVLEQDFSLATAFTNPAITQDFIQGVATVLLGDKETRKQRPAWNPSTFSEVKASDILEKFFPKTSSDKTATPKLQLAPAKPYTKYPYSYGLPTEQFIADVVKGSNPGSGAYAMTKAEVMKTVAAKSSQKVGLEAHVDEVLSRKAQVSSDGTLKWIY